jgi:F-box interacting protein
VRGYIERIFLDGVDEDTVFAGQTGLGYDSEYNVHVLVLVTYKEKNFATRDYQIECKLRYVDDHECHSLVPPPRPVADVQPTFVDGKIFWLVEPNLGPISLICEIIAFGVHTEEFEVLQGPPCSNLDNGHRSILQLHGALCVACSDKSSNVIDIWMMKDVNIWSMEYHIELGKFSQEYPSERTTPLAVDPTDGRILLSTGNSLGYYDPVTAAMETLYRDDDMQWPDNMQWTDRKFCPVICEESFVSTLQDERQYGQV